MTLTEKLCKHKGGLIRIKTQLYWYGDHEWDNNSNRICLVLDAVMGSTKLTGPAEATTRPLALTMSGALVLLLMGEDAPRWIWVVDGDVEIII